MEKLPIKEKDGYLQLDDLPYNCIFNKVWTGCGATTIALTNNENYIIAVPTTELIQNKCYPPFYDGKSYNWNAEDKEVGLSPMMNLFGLYGDNDGKLDERIRKYLKSKGVKKIICTYDKVAYLLNYINPKDFRFLCDEYHSFLKVYTLRYYAIDNILDCYKLFKSYCFMSATPISNELRPNALEGITEYVADWKAEPELGIALFKSNKVFYYASTIIKDYQKDGYITINDLKSYEAFFFINSVTDIAKILKHCTIDKNECRIICADNRKNRKKLGKYEISSSSSETKKFNFITSKSFEGVDFYSETGFCFVVSSASKEHTLLNIDTDIPQIAGRIRTKSNPFRYLIMHIFSTPKQDSNISAKYEDVVEATIKEEKSAQERADNFNTLPPNAKQQQIQELNRIGQYSYVRYNSKEEKFVVNDMTAKCVLYAYKLKNLIYNSGKELIKSYANSGVSTTNIVWNFFQDEELSKDICKGQSFYETLKEFIEEKKTKSLIVNSLKPRMIEIKKEYPFLESAWNVLGGEELLKLRSMKKIKTALAAKHPSDEMKPFVYTRNECKIGDFISNAEAKEIAKECGGAKGTDLNKWLNLQIANITVNKKRVKGYHVLSYKDPVL